MNALISFFLNKRVRFPSPVLTLKPCMVPLCSIKSNAIGLDEIPIKSLILIFPVFGNYFLHLVNTILTTSTFPTNWKKSYVIPIPKIKTVSEYNDFRPISILPAFSKAVEVIIKSQIEKGIPLDSLLDTRQSGFRKNFSTTSAVLDLTDQIRSNMDNHLISTLILLDFKKAFDSVPHDILVDKLKTFFYFSSTACNFVFSYLTSRFQCVKLKRNFSSVLCLNKGVPQGSLLGPLLFSMYINDITKCTSFCQSRLFADDFQLLHVGSYNTMNNNYTEIKHDLDSILNWSLQNRLEINPY